MKGLKVKKLSIILILLLFSTNIFATSKHCFSSEISFYCQKQDEDNFSLEGYFPEGDVNYKFSSRRAFDGDWCQETLSNIQRIITSNNYCIEFDENSGTELTINKIHSSNSSWSYFN